ncbi:MAG TPA: ComF family protein [Candidatus Atribacteria bacterium]|nr:ComF family protein [Candidatus Atribacteria bacterium]
MFNQLQLPSRMTNNPPLGWSLLDALFPPFCCSCGVLGFELCPDCTNKILIIDQKKTCPICGDFSEKGRICQECRDNRPFYDQLRSWGEYSGVLRDAIRKFKFNHCLGLIRYLSKPSAEFIQSWNIKIDHIVPVPLSNTRQHSRGYNQSALLANSISKILRIESKYHAISRVKETLSQVGLNPEERRGNVFDAFKADIDESRNKSILVLDDIATTGSTLNECAKALKNAGAKEVFCFTVAKTPITKTLFEDYGG